MCLMGLRPMLLFGWCDVYSDAAGAPANEKGRKQFNVNLFNNTTALLHDNSETDKGICQDNTVFQFDYPWPCLTFVHQTASTLLKCP